MASNKLDPAVIQRTKDTLGKVIKKPALTEKLLNRPPFRYLHDIISEVIKSTGFFRGLYTPQELDAKSIQDKDSKVAFLQKALDTLSFTTGDLVRAKPSKIVSGQESERTNEFLQILSIAILKQLSSTEAVQRVLKGEKPGETLSKEKRKRSHGEKGERKERKEENGSKRSRSKERSSDDGQHSGEGAARTKPKEAAKAKANDSPSLHTKSQQSLKSSSSENLKDSDQVPERPKHRPSRRRPPPQESEASPLENHTGGEGDEEVEVGSGTQLDRPSSAKGSRRRRTHNQEEGETRAGVPPSATADELGPTYDVIPESQDTNTTANRSSSSPPPPKALLAPGNRPSSARPPPPKIVRQSSTIEDTSARIPSGHSVPPPTVILEVPGRREGEGEEEEDSQFLVKDATPLDLPPTEAFLGGSEAIGDKPEGALTRTIVATKERLEGDVPQSELPSHHPGISEAQRRKEREMVAREIERLQASIQTLCKSANPLGKNMDYVQEDMDSMQKELETWRTENGRHAEALRKEERITELELSPLRAQLEELEARIVEQVDLISATKANILRNDDKIQQMLNSVAFSSS